MATILVAEDFAPLRLLVRTLLATEGVTIVEAADGEEAWALIKQVRPRVVICDLNLPLWTGMDLLQAAAADPEVQGTPFIVITGDDGRENAALAAGAWAVLIKPFTVGQIRDAVRRALTAVK
jgi:CheY-like chemotaxis protein